MMNVVIIGASEVGSHIAATLSKAQHNVILVDKDSKKLEKASWGMDVATRQGSGNNWQLLEDLLELSPDILIALTNNDETNLVCCSIAKHLGYPRTIARVRNDLYLNRSRLDFARMFDVDYFISPELLVAHDVVKLMLNPGSLMTENFAHGAVQLQTFIIPPDWSRSTQSLRKLKLPSGIICGLILRKGAEEYPEGELIFPHGDDFILPGDEVTMIGEAECIWNCYDFFGIERKTVHSVVIVGGSLTAINLAPLLERRKIDVRIVEKDYDKCCILADLLPNCTIINHDGTDLDFLQSEKIGQAEVIVTCTGCDETNLMAALLGKEAGCSQAIVMLTNTSYIPFVQRQGIYHTVSPRVSATNHILSQILTGTVSSLISLYENRAEIIEINVPMDSKVVGIPLSELGPLLPKDFLIAMIQNRGRIMIAHGERIISPGDTVIVITNPKHVPELENLF